MPSVYVFIDPFSALVHDLTAIFAAWTRFNRQRASHCHHLDYDRMISNFFLPSLVFMLIHITETLGQGYKCQGNLLLAPLLRLVGVCHLP